MKHFSLHLLGGFAMFVLAILLGLTVLHFFSPYVLYLSESVLPEINNLTLFLLVALNDFVVTPVSPDIAIFLIAQRAPDSYMLISVLGAASVLGGALAWLCGRFLENKFKVARLESFVRKNHALINKYGVWIVALGALTPVPYSLTCWAAGALKMDFSKFFLMILLRIPRFVIYFHFFGMSAGYMKGMA
jgi:membrane protein YqaA with SNARE-associated domain